MAQKKILLMGSTYGTPEIIRYAREQGIYTIVTDNWSVEDSYGKALADEYWMISTADVDILEQKCRKEKIDGLICGISEFNQDMIIELSERLNLPCYCTRESWHYNRNKADFKVICKKVGAPVAQDYILTDALTDDELDTVQFPVVVKPVDKCSNQGISFCYNKEELVQAYKYARSVSSNPTVIVEKMIRGGEYFAYYALAEGEISLVTIASSYYQSGNPSNCYSVNTTVTGPVDRFFEETNDIVKEVLKEAGCREGIAWVQLMKDEEDGRFYLIEMGYRLSGEMLFIPLKEISGFDSVKWMVEYAMGKKHTKDDLPISQKKNFAPCACSYVLWSNQAGKAKKVEGFEEIAKIPGVTIAMGDAREGEWSVEHSQLANILFTAKDCREMCEIIDKVNNLVSITNEKDEDMVIRYTEFDKLNHIYESGRKKLLVFGSTLGTPEIIQYAREQGVYTIVTDNWSVEDSYGKALANEYWMISTADVDKLEQKCRKEKIDGLICGISEFNQDMIVELSERLNLPCYCTRKAWHYNRNKADFKAVCKKVGAPVAKDYFLSDELSENEVEKVQFPVVVKPVDKCSNQGISFCYNRQELVQAYKYARKVSKNPAIIVEKLIEGEEFYALYALAQGEITLLTMAASYHQSGTPRNCYSVNTTITGSVDLFFKQTDAQVRAVLKEIGCREGIAWVQLMRDKTNGKFYLIEMGYRLSGEMIWIPLKELIQFDSVKWMVECALGEKHTPENLPVSQRENFIQCACSYLLWSNQDGVVKEIIGLDTIAQIPGVISVIPGVRVEDKIQQYIPLVIVHIATKNCQKMCEIVKRINQSVSIKNECGEDIIIRYNEYEKLQSFYKSGMDSRKDEKEYLDV